MESAFGKTSNDADLSKTVEACLDGEINPYDGANHQAEVSSLIGNRAVFDRGDPVWEPCAPAFGNEVFNSCGNIAAWKTSSWRCLQLKRGVDIAGSLMMLAVSLIPGLMIAAAIVHTSRGPVFYREMRVGRGGGPFRIWKFRSMREDAGRREALRDLSCNGGLLSMRVRKDFRDPRVTSLGGFLRCWSLDELPQSLNVLCGEMSLVGPRPVVEAELILYGPLRSFYLTATPGISGLWQVSGRSNLAFAIRAGLDASYVRNWSLLTDFQHSDSDRSRRFEPARRTIEWRLLLRS
jgi:exopolysaccharide production protein ExoY